MRFFAVNAIFAIATAIKIEQSIWDTNADGAMSARESAAMLTAMHVEDAGGDYHAVDYREIARDLNTLYNPEAPWRGWVEWHTDAISEVYVDDTTGELQAGGVVSIYDTMLGVDIPESSGQLIIDTFDADGSGGLDQSEQDAMWYYLLGYTTLE